MATVREDDVLLTTKEVAELLGCSYQTVQRHRRLGKGVQPVIRFTNSNVRYRKRDVEAYIASHTEEAVA